MRNIHVEELENHVNIIDDIHDINNLLDLLEHKKQLMLQKPDLKTELKAETKAEEIYLYIYNLTHENFQLVLKRLKQGEIVGVGSNKKQAADYDYFLYCPELDGVEFEIVHEYRKCTIYNVSKSSKDVLLNNKQIHNDGHTLNTGDFIYLYKLDESLIYTKSFPVYIDDKPIKKSLLDKLSNFIR